MGPAPLPPHERAWRHPSELAPTLTDVDLRSASSPRSLMFATGAATALLTAMLVVGLNSPRSSAPIAVSATTLPAPIVQPSNVGVQFADVAIREQSIVRTNNLTKNQGLALAGAPMAVSTAPLADLDAFATATEVPDDGAPVLLLTASHVFNLAWGDVDHLTSVPDGSVVITLDGALVAIFVAGEARLLIS